MRSRIILKDHLCERTIDRVALRTMDWLANARHGFDLGYRSWSKKAWLRGFSHAEVAVNHWSDDLRLYPFGSEWAVGGRLHFLAALDPDDRSESPDLLDDTRY